MTVWLYIQVNYFYFMCFSLIQYFQLILHPNNYCQPNEIDDCVDITFVNSVSIHSVTVNGYKRTIELSSEPTAR